MEIKNSNQEDIEIKRIINFIFRNKLTISFITLSATLITVIISSFSESIYKGNFQIVVDSEKNSKSANAFGIASELVPQLSGSGNNRDIKTQASILRSPYVLRPVFNYVVNEYKKRGEDIVSINYENWAKSKLLIKFEEGTNVLNIDFKDKDKALIINTLELIREKYQNYSKY